MAYIYGNKVRCLSKHYKSFVIWKQFLLPERLSQKYAQYMMLCIRTSVESICCININISEIQPWRVRGRFNIFCLRLFVQSVCNGCAFERNTLAVDATDRVPTPSLGIYGKSDNTNSHNVSILMGFRQKVFGVIRELPPPFMYQN